MSDTNKPVLAPIGIDTNILIYESLNEKKLLAIDDKEQRNEKVLQHRRARRLLRRCHEEKRPVMLSIISVGEYLVKVENSQRDEMAKRLDRRFVIAPYNRQAAIFAARIVESTKNPKKAVRIVGGRPVVMADAKIIASLIAAEASLVYLHDGGAIKMASGFIPAKPLPEHSDDLFDFGEDQHL